MSYLAMVDATVARITRRARVIRRRNDGGKYPKPPTDLAGVRRCEKRPGHRIDPAGHRSVVMRGRGEIPFRCRAWTLPVQRPGGNHQDFPRETPDFMAGNSYQICRGGFAGASPFQGMPFQWPQHFSQMEDTSRIAIYVWLAGIPSPAAPPPSGLAEKWISITE